MASTKVKSNKNVGFFVGPKIAVANLAEGMTLAEASALTNISSATKWDSFDLNVQASEQDEDRALTDADGAATRGYENFGGNASFFTPVPSDLSSIERRAKNLVGKMHTELVAAIRPRIAAGAAWAAGQIYNAFQTITDATRNQRGDKNRYYEVNFRQKGEVLVNGIIPSSPATAVAVAPTAPSVAVGKSVQIRSTYEGHDITVGADYKVTDETIAVVTPHGKVIGLKPGTTKFTATYPGSAAGTEMTITVTAT